MPHFTSTYVGNMKRFAHEHDDLPAFHAGFLMLTFLCAILLPLGAFVVLVAIHALLDVYKYRDRHGYSWKKVWKGVVKEGLMDGTLIIIGFVFAVYLHHSTGIETVSMLMRMEMWMLRFFGTTIPKLTILHSFLKILSHVHHYIEQIHPRMRKGWSKLDQLCFIFIGVAVLMLVIAPVLLGVETRVVTDILRQELLFWHL